MTFKDFNEKENKESFWSYFTTMDKISIIVGIVVNVALLFLYLVLR